MQTKPPPRKRTKTVLAPKNTGIEIKLHKIFSRSIENLDAKLKEIIQQASKVELK